MTEIDFTTPAPQLEALDLGHLLGTSAAATYGQLDLLAKNYPKLTADPRYHEVRATVLVGEGKAMEALETLRDPRQNAGASSPRRTLITSFAQAAQTSSPPDAASFRETVQWRGLIREEREFFTQLLERQFAGDEAPASPADPTLR